MIFGLDRLYRYLACKMQIASSNHIVICFESCICFQPKYSQDMYKGLFSCWSFLATVASQTGTDAEENHRTTQSDRRCSECANLVLLR